jgi:hypothetical protein
MEDKYFKIKAEVNGYVAESPIPGRHNSDLPVKRMTTKKLFNPSGFAA